MSINISTKVVNALIFAIFLFFLSLAPIAEGVDVARVPYSTSVESLLSSGRFFALLTGLSWLIINIKNLKFILAQRTPKTIVGIFVIQFLLCLKQFYFGHFGESFSGLAILSLQIFVILKIASFYLQKGGLQFLTSSLLFCSILTVLTNMILVLTVPESAFVNGTRLTGTAANPQHLMLFLALLLPSAISSVLISNGTITYMLTGLLASTGIVYLIFLTGSRTGLLVIILSILFIIFTLLRKRSQVRYFGVALGFTALFGAIIFGPSALTSSNILIRGDTRTHVWIAEFDRFLEFPVFGVPPNSDGKFFFSETLWLSMLANGGVLSGIILLSLMVYILRSLVKILVIRRTGSLEFQVSGYFLLVLFVLSIFEAVFAGRFTAFAFLSFVYLVFSERYLMRSKVTREKEHFLHVE